ncbi:MAG TPA: FtsX-like permease family protein [Bryobacteraceae bacterium]
MRRLYRMMLRIYPAGFREEYGRALERQFADDYREAEGRRERIEVGLRALKDLAVTAPGEIARELWQDLRYAVRIYRQRPVATGLALAALAVAIGATTGIFSVLNALLIRSLPFREPDRLVELSRFPVSPLSGRNAVESWFQENHYLEEFAPWDVMFRPLNQYEQLATTFVARVRGNPEGYLPACRDAVQGTDPGVPVFDVKTLDQRLADVVARPRFYTTAILFLAGFALLLAAVGAYGAASHSVSQRRHEIGIRIAVGGPPGRVRGMVFRQSMAPVCVGVVAG